MISTITILERLAQREMEAKAKNDDLPPFSVAAMVAALKNHKSGTCAECGMVTYDQFYGVYLCSPYNQDGSLKHPDRRCKWIWRDGAGAAWKARNP